MGVRQGDVIDLLERPNMHLLLVSADNQLATMLAAEATRAGHVVVAHGRSADLIVESFEPGNTVVVVDWLLPDEPGIELCRRLRSIDAHQALPVILLVGSSNEADKRLAVEAGADAILLKPISVKELMARITALSAGRPQEATLLGTLKGAGIELHIAAQVARHRGRPVHLGTVDMRLLEFLLASGGCPVTRSQIRCAVWVADPPSERTIDVYIARLRKALRLAWKRDPIRTIKGVGYALDALHGRATRPGRARPAHRLIRSGHRQPAE